MASSRIFVRGLPPSLSDGDFRKHFAAQNAITDAKLIPHRRIGYVGYKTEDDAVKAVKYFNKSFIRMSRIAVEIARPIGDEALPSSRHTQAYTGSSGANAAPLEGPKRELKRKREAPINVEEDPKLRQFLQVMQPPSKSKSWSNEDSSRIIENVVPTPAAQVSGAAEDDDDEIQVIPRNSKHVKVESKDVAAKETAGQTVASRPSAVGEEADVEVVMADALPSQAKVPVDAADDDWLRSRTSRLLDLADEDDEMGAVGSTQVVDDVEVEEDQALPREVDDKPPAPSPELKVEKPPEAQETSEADTAAVESLRRTGRLFVRNLPYEATENELRHHFASYGTLEEVHLPLDKTGKSKGFAYVLFENHEAAIDAHRSGDGQFFQGRLLHILPAAGKKDHKLDEYAISKLPLKKQKQIRRKAEAATSTFNWNSMFMSADAILSSTSDRLGVSKSDLLDPTSSDAAVKQAHAETHIIQETKAYFAANGVDLDAFKQRERGDTTILVKNFPYGTSPDELKALFHEFGQIDRLLMPPTGTIAMVEFSQAPQARAAFASLAYRRFKDSVLFLEKAPKDIFVKKGTMLAPVMAIAGSKAIKASTTELLQSEPDAAAVASPGTATLFVRNLNFITTSARLTEVFEPLAGFLSARVKTKPDPKKAGGVLSMGFGFLEFRSPAEAQAAMSAMNEYSLDGHMLLIRASHRGLDAAAERKKLDSAKKAAGKRTKIIIKNLPFEASKKEIRSLFGAYGQLRSVRVPKKFDSSTRGFAFADFVTTREAENAMEALGDTHLLGRRLVLEFAAEDPLDAEEEIAKMQKKVGRQANQVALQRLTGGGRKKIQLDGEADEEA